ncbi:MAG: SIS domain-containing protein [Acaryochloris sp. RU_4_1]|nr:SIS domain-containing protein [Acaryochloris sp. RU_4_1]NJR55752.1 SIS domain-containing protein [Acaryochloris sp. CRU_2_0]
MSYQSDVQEQPQVLHALIKTYQQQSVWSALTSLGEPRTPIILTGMGASYNALYPTWFYLNQQGRSAFHIDTSTLIHYLHALLDTPCVIIAVSQSGESIEIQRLVEQVEVRRRQEQAPCLISVTNSSSNTLAEQSDLSLVTQAGSEVGIATKTYTSSLLLLNLLAKALVGKLQAEDFERGRAIATLLQTYLAESATAIHTGFEALRTSSYVAIMGRGPALATAKNSALIFKEGVRIPAEGYSSGQFRHGPREMITPQIGAIVLTSPDHTLELNQRLASDILAYGGQLICIGQPGATGGVDIPLPIFEDPYLYPILEILPLQLLAEKLAVSKNITLGEFRWSGKVVKQE